MRKFILVILIIFSLIIYTCDCEDLTRNHSKYYGTPKSDKRMKEIEEQLEKHEKGLLPTKSKIEILSVYLKSREYGNMQIIGELKNNHSIAVGVELQATAYDKQGRIIDVIEFWPASIRNIPAGDVYPYKYYFNVKEVYRATIRVIRVKVWD